VLLVLPHRKSPQAYALNLLRRAALFDQPTKEQLNRMAPDEFTDALLNAFPCVNADSILQNLPTATLVDGLVLKNRQGQGALQPVGHPPKPLKVNEWQEQMRLNAYQKQGAL